jgi:hypothetical protein
MPTLIDRPAIVQAANVTPTKTFAWASSPSIPPAPTPIRGADRAKAREHAEAIRAYLDVEKKEHVRYLKQAVTEGGPKQTFCNVYAHDAATLSGAYLPLVWWTSSARKRIAAGEDVTASIKQKTVTALKANVLCDWFVAQSSAFGWTKLGGAIEAQKLANDGHFVVVVARGHVTGPNKRSAGHIAWVVEEEGPEVGTDAVEATFVPTISQAGSNNHRRSTARGRWWTKPTYDVSGFWSHPGSRAV